MDAMKFATSVALAAVLAPTLTGCGFVLDQFANNYVAEIEEPLVKPTPFAGNEVKASAATVTVEPNTPVELVPDNAGLWDQSLRFLQDTDALEGAPPKPLSDYVTVTVSDFVITEGDATGRSTRSPGPRDGDESATQGVGAITLGAKPSVLKEAFDEAFAAGVAAMANDDCFITHSLDASVITFRLTAECFSAAIQELMGSTVTHVDQLKFQIIVNPGVKFHLRFEPRGMIFGQRRCGFVNKMRAQQENLERITVENGSVGGYIYASQPIWLDALVEFKDADETIKLQGFINQRQPILLEANTLYQVFDGLEPQPAPSGVAMKDSNGAAFSIVSELQVGEQGQQSALQFAKAALDFVQVDEAIHPGKGFSCAIWNIRSATASDEVPAGEVSIQLNAEGKYSVSVDD